MTDSNLQTSSFSFSEVFDILKEEVKNQIWVSMPASVVKYDGKSLDVKPDLNRNYNNEEKEFPVIYDVPLLHPRAGKAFIHLPIEVGHKVLLHFSSRSIEDYLKSGQRKKPLDPRTHSISDCWAQPSGYPFSDPPKLTNLKDIIIRHGDGMEIRIKSNGKWQIENSQYEFQKLLCDILEDLSQSVVYTCNGPKKLKHTRLRKDIAKMRSFLVE